MPIHTLHRIIELGALIAARRVVGAEAQPFRANLKWIEAPRQSVRGEVAVVPRVTPDQPPHQIGAAEFAGLVIPEYCVSACKFDP